MDEDLKELFAELAKSQANFAKTQNEISKSIKELVESQKRTDEQMAKTDVQLAMTDVQLKKTMAKVDKIAEMYGGVGNSQGMVAEEFFYNSLRHNPELGGIRFDYIRKNVTGSLGNIQEEYDIILINGTIVYLIEVKYRLRKEDIDRYLERKVPRFTVLFPEYKDFEIRVAFASFFVTDELVEYAKAQDILVLKRRGKVFEALAA